MAILIDENILLGVAGLVFIPVLVFFVKLIIEVGNIKSKIDGINNQITKSETGFKTKPATPNNKFSSIEIAIIYLNTK